MEKISLNICFQVTAQLISCDTGRCALGKLPFDFQVSIKFSPLKKGQRIRKAISFC